MLSNDCFMAELLSRSIGGLKFGSKVYIKRRSTANNIMIIIIIIIIIIIRVKERTSNYVAATMQYNSILKVLSVMIQGSFV